MEAKFRLDLSDEEAVHYLQSLIDESVSAMFAVVVEQIHKFAQVRIKKISLNTFRQQIAVKNVDIDRSKKT